MEYSKLYHYRLRCILLSLRILLCRLNLSYNSRHNYRFRYPEFLPLHLGLGLHFYPELLQNSHIEHYMHERTYERKNMDAKYTHERKEDKNQLPTNVMDNFRAEFKRHLGGNKEPAPPAPQAQPELTIVNRGDWYNCGAYKIQPGQTISLPVNEVKRLMEAFNKPDKIRFELVE